jgi:hydroxymethylbilane synthase
MIRSKKMIKRIRIGTRNSNLALWQANFVKKKIELHFPKIKITLKHIQTQGDIDQVSSLTQVGGRGIFIKTIEKALIENKIDLAVHSLKDLPTEIHESLDVTAVPERGPISDVFIGSKDSDFNKLTKGATIASGSIRRRTQLLALRPDLNLVDLRGNIETRLRKLKQNQYDGIIMAEAALTRLNMKDVNYYRFTSAEMLPAVGQGAIGIQTKMSDQQLVPVLEKLNDLNTFLCVTAERSFLHRLDSGCQFPVAANAEIIENKLILSGLVASMDGYTILKDTISGLDTEAQQIGITLAEKLIAEGANELLHGADGHVNSR